MIIRQLVLLQMVWSEQEINLKKEVNKPMTFTAEIKNIGGAQQTYKLENLPSWLTAVPSSGTIEPLKSQVITFTVNQGVNLGNYNENIYLASDLGFSEKLPINMLVYIPEPDWKVNPSDYQYSMNVIGQLTINGVISTDVNDMIGVFIGNVCRGVVHLTYVEEYDRYLAYLDMYSKSVIGDTLVLKVWDASEGKIITKVTPIFIFQNNDIQGSPSKPVNISTEEYYQGSIALNSGWNWVSFNLNSLVLNNLPKLLEGVALTDMDMIKGQTAFDIYSTQAGAWTGSLSSSKGIAPGKMYMVKVSKADTINYEGPKAFAKTPLPMRAGWNWLGYLPQGNITPAEAFAAFNPQTNDVVKSQYSFALFDKNLGWLGSLKYMTPGTGYMFRAGLAGTLIYPEKSMLKSSAFYNGLPNGYQTILKEWNVYPYNMTIIARLQDENDNNINENFLLKALSTGKNRGMCESQDLSGQSLYFITVYSNVNGDSIKFSLTDVSGNTIEASNSLLFKADEQLGTYENPYIIRIKSETVLTSVMDYSSTEPLCFPNPFRSKLTIVLGTLFDSKVNIEICDINGRAVFTKTILDAMKNNTFEFDGTGLYKGVYILNISDVKFSRRIKLVKEY